ncbi:MAG: LA2681 family HEPN domain-containing protein [Acidimicrobiia bacterium]
MAFGDSNATLDRPSALREKSNFSSESAYRSVGVLVILTESCLVEQHEFEEVYNSLSLLLDSDPGKVLEEAQKLAKERPDDSEAKRLSSIFMIEAGGLLKMRTAVSSGVKILEELCSGEQNFRLIYNLANGLEALATLDSTAVPNWYLVTHQYRFRARSLYWKSSKEMSPLTSRSLTNLGNSLSTAHRWIEAYSYFRRACRGQKSFGPAALQAAILIRHRLQRPWHTEELPSLYRYYLDLALARKSEILEVCGEPGIRGLDNLPSIEIEPWSPPANVAEDPYRAFVIENRLMLSPLLEICQPNDDHLDDLHFGPVTTSIMKMEIPSIFAMLNCIKQEYLEARDLFYAATRESYPLSDPGFVNTLDYALFGNTAAKLCLAQRSGLDVLDRIAVAVDVHLGNSTNPRSISFRNYWRKGDKQRTWTQQIEGEIQAGSPSAIALSEVAEDLSKGGFLSSQADMRNASTHRFVVLHTEGVPVSPQDEGYIERYGHSDFVEATRETLQLARAAIIYFVDLITSLENHDGSAITQILSIH